MSINKFLLTRLILNEKNSLNLTIVIILSIAIGKIIIILILSIMNGFQNDFFLSIVNVEIGNLKIENELTPKELKEIKNIKGITQINRIYETHGIGLQNYYYPNILNIIAVDTKDLKEDQNFISFTGLKNFELDLKVNEIIIGSVLSYNLNLFEDNTLNLIIIDEIQSLKTLNEGIKEFKIKSIFNSSYTKLDEFLIFMNIEYFIKNKIIQHSDINYQIKTTKLNPSSKLIKKIKNINPNIQLKTWNEYNKEFYKTLKIEKNTMLIVLISIFFIISVNTYYLQKRILINKNKAISVLLYLGIRTKKVKEIFLIHSLLICIIGGLIGLILGIFTSLNINEILRLIDTLINNFINISNQILGSKTNNIKVQIVKNLITPKIFLSDLISILLFIFSSTIYSSMKVTKKIGETKKTIEL